MYANSLEGLEELVKLHGVHCLLNSVCSFSLILPLYLKDPPLPFYNTSSKTSILTILYNTFNQNILYVNCAHVNLMLTMELFWRISPLGMYMLTKPLKHFPPLPLILPLIGSTEYLNPLTAVSVYTRPDHFSCAKKIVKYQLFVQKSRKIYQTVEN